MQQEIISLINRFIYELENKCDIYGAYANQIRKASLAIQHINDTNDTEFRILGFLLTPIEIQGEYIISKESGRRSKKRYREHITYYIDSIIS